MDSKKERWIGEILAERERQDRKWGTPQENTYCEWSSILTEEVGELAKELNELNFGRGDKTRMEAEAVQVAAVALAILEQSAIAQKVTAKMAEVRFSQNQNPQALTKQQEIRQELEEILQPGFRSYDQDPWGP